jgi:hypothetical protein
VRQVLARASNHNGVYVLDVTQGGHPKHPLYVPAKTVPFLWMPRGGS